MLYCKILLFHPNAINVAVIYLPRFPAFATVIEEEH